MKVNSLANVRMFFKSLWNLILGGNVAGSGVKLDKFTVEVEVGGCCSSAGVSGGNERYSGWTCLGLAVHRPVHPFSEYGRRLYDPGLAK